MQIISSFYEWWFEKEMRRGFDALFFDMDGTLLLGKRDPVPGALKLIRRLRRENFPFRILTNDGNHSLNEICSFFTRAGFDILPEEVVSCSLALKEMAEEHALRGEKVFVMGDLGKPENYAALAGMLPVTDPAEIDSCRAIVAGEGYYDWHKVFHAVLNFFARHPDRLFLVPNPDSYWPDGRGGFGIGAGASARFLRGLLREMGLEPETIFLGKPFPAVFQHAVNEIVRDYALPEIPEMSRILMLGDFLPSDIRGANACGMTSALLLTGVTPESRLTEPLLPEEVPDYVFKHIACDKMTAL